MVFNKQAYEVMRPQEAMKLTPWSSRLIVNVRAVISGHHRGYRQSLFNAN